MVASLDEGLRNLAELIRRDVGVYVETTPGAGAAGGVGAAAMAFLGAQLMPGIEIILDVTHFQEQLRDAALVFTGEGRVDSQTLGGKVINGVMNAARRREVPVIVLAGGVEREGYELMERGATAVLSIVNGPMSLAEAQDCSTELLQRAAEQAMRLIGVRC
jgi:glycerate kinase